MSVFGGHRTSYPNANSARITVLKAAVGVLLTLPTDHPAWEGSLHKIEKFAKDMRQQGRLLYGDAKPIDHLLAEPAEKEKGT